MTFIPKNYTDIEHKTFLVQYHQFFCYIIKHVKDVNIRWKLLREIIEIYSKRIHRRWKDDEKKRK